MAEYSVEGLREGIRNCKKNVQVLEDAIVKERNTIKEYKIMIDDIGRADKAKKEAEENVKIEVIDERK